MREFVVAKAQREDRLELVTFQAYQTVRIHWMTKAKKGRMPDFKSLLKRSGTGYTLDARTSPTMASAFMQMLAAKAGSKVQPVKRDRLVVGV